MFNQYNPFFYQMPAKFSFQSLLTNTQKTLNIINQALPIVKEVKPIVNNARTLFGVMKGFNKVDNRNNYTISKEVTNNVKENNNGLNFFV